jgi:hypothetical protein
MKSASISVNKTVLVKFKAHFLLKVIALSEINFVIGSLNVISLSSKRLNRAGYL